MALSFLAYGQETENLLVPIQSRVVHGTDARHLDIPDKYVNNRRELVSSKDIDTRSYHLSIYLLPLC